MTAEELAVLGGLVIVSGTLKDVGVYLIQKGLGKNGHCKDHGSMCAILKRLEGKDEENSLSRTIEDAVRRGMVSGSDPRD